MSVVLLSSACSATIFLVKLSYEKNNVEDQEGNANRNYDGEGIRIKTRRRVCIVRVDAANVSS